LERRIAAWLLIVTIFAVVFAIYPNNRSSILSKEVAYVISAAALSLVLGVAIARGVKLNERMGLPLVASFAALLAWMVIRHFTGLRSVYGPHTIYSLAALGMVGGTAGLLLDRKARTTVLWGLVAATGLLCIYTALQWMNVIMFPWDIYLSIAGRLSGSLGNPNLLGSFMASFIPVGVAFMLTRSFRPILRIALALLITAACVLCIVSSGTRGSMIGLVAGMGLMGLVLTLRQKSAGWKRFIPLGAAVAALLVVFSSMRTRFIELADPAHGTAQVRLVIWTGSLAMFEEKPIQGWGPGTFQVVFPRFRNLADSTPLSVRIYFVAKAGGASSAGSSIWTPWVMLFPIYTISRLRMSVCPYELLVKRKARTAVNKILSSSIVKRICQSEE